mgnify:CR=1 FL=1
MRKYITKKWFTLMEIIVVISIIGTLAFVLYPNLKNYILNSRVVNYQNTVAETINIINLYRNEVWEIWTGASLFCFSENEDTSCNSSNRHVGMSNFITKNNPKLHNKIKTFLDSWIYGPLLIYSYDSLSHRFWAEYDLQRNMNTTVWILTWYIADRAPWIPDWYWLYRWSWYDPISYWAIYSGVLMLPTELDKTCSPGNAYAGLSMWSGEYKVSYCYYLFE